MAKDQAWQHSLPDNLLQHLGRTVGAMAADVWQTKYLASGSPDVISFMREVSGTLSFDARQRNALRAAVHQARAQSGGVMSPRSASRPELQVVGQAVLDRWMVMLKARAIWPRRAFVIDVGKRLQRPDCLFEDAKPVLAAMVQSTHVPILNQAQWSRLLHALYVEMCQALGPVVADDIVHDAMREVAKLPEAVQCPPAQFFNEGSV